MCELTTMDLFKKKTVMQQEVRVFFADTEENTCEFISRIIYKNSL